MLKKCVLSVLISLFVWHICAQEIIKKSELDIVNTAKPVQEIILGYMGSFDYIEAKEKEMQINAISNCFSNSTINNLLHSFTVDSQNNLMQCFWGNTGKRFNTKYLKTSNTGVQITFDTLLHGASVNHARAEIATVRAVKEHPDARFSNVPTGIVEIWNGLTGALKHKLEDAMVGVNEGFWVGVTYSPCGKYLAYFSREGTKIIDAHSYQPVCYIFSAKRANEVLEDQDGNPIDANTLKLSEFAKISAYFKGTVWAGYKKLADGAKSSILLRYARALEFSADGKYIAYGTPGKIAIFEFKQNPLLK